MCLDLNSVVGRLFFGIATCHCLTSTFVWDDRRGCPEVPSYYTKLMCSVCLSVCLFVCLPVCLSVCRLLALAWGVKNSMHALCLSVCLSVRPPVCLSVCLPAVGPDEGGEKFHAPCLSVRPSVCLSVCLSVWLSAVSVGLSGQSHIKLFQNLTVHFATSRC